jgi:hypothetical protein
VALGAACASVGSNVRSAMGGSYTLTPGTCSPQGGVVQGDATPTMPTTICCL